MKKLAILLSLALAALPCTSALASNLTFSFSGTTFSGSGDLTYTNTGTADRYLLTAGTGSISYNGITYALALLPPNTFAANDNLFFTHSNTPFDFGGIGFSLVNSSNLNLNLYNVPPDDTTPYELLGANRGPQIATEMSDFNITLLPNTVTPEPGSLALLGTGALGACGVLRRKLTA